MKRIVRLPLDTKTTAVLAKMQETVDADGDPRERARRLWAARHGSNPRKKAFSKVRETLGQMATGRRRCMYCEDSLGTDIEHFRPKSKYPHSAFHWPNYLLACSHCNSNEKRSEFPVDAAGSPMLIDPTVEDPRDHLIFVPSTGKVVGWTPRGEETVRVFGLNRNDTLEKGRKQAWTSAQALLRDYHAARNDEARQRVLDALEGLSFGSVLVHLFALASSTPAPELVPPDIQEIVRAHRAAFTWI